jgi:hypothetical protein
MEMNRKAGVLRATNSAPILWLRGGLLQPNVNPFNGQFVNKPGNNGQNVKN